MQKTKATEILTNIVNLLEPMESGDRMRIINAALVLLGETSTPTRIEEGASIPEDADSERSLSDLPPRARTWMRQHDVSNNELEQVFNVVDGAAEVIASHIPGKNKKEQTLNCYVLTGIAQLITTGNPNFLDNNARNLCVQSGCYDSGNHATTMKGKGSNFSGTKEKGWTLTAPGLKHAALLIKELSRAEE